MNITNMCDNSNAKVVRFESGIPSPVNNSNRRSAFEFPSLQAPASSSTNWSSGTYDSMETFKLSNQAPSTPMILDTPFGNEELVRDYDTDVTKLYQLLESSDWEAAVERCRTHPIEAQTWIIRRQKKDKNQVRWKLLPLHSAVIFASPDFVVAALLEQYRTAVTETDDQGMTPLHLAFRHYQDDDGLISLLLEAWPECITCKDYRGRSPIDLAMKRNKAYPARLMNQYASACIEITLKAQDAINRAVNEMSRYVSPRNDKNVVCSQYDDSPEDEKAELEKDEIALLDHHEQVLTVQEKPSINKEPFEAGYEVDEIERLEREDREMGEIVTLEKEERDGIVVQTIAEKEATIETPFLQSEIEPDDSVDKNDQGSYESDSFCSAVDESVPETTDSSVGASEDTLSNGMKAIERTTMEERISRLKDEHGREMAALRSFYEERMQSMADHASTSLRKLYDETKQANRELKEQHHQHIQRIKNCVAEEEKKKSEACQLLQNEIDQLRVSLHQEMERRQSHDEMMNDLRTLQQDHLTLQTLLQNQQKELDTTQQIRALMLKTLWQQDEEEGETRKMEAEGISVLADRIHTSFARLLPESSRTQVVANTPTAAVDVTEAAEEREPGEDKCHQDDDDDLSSITGHLPHARFKRSQPEITLDECVSGTVGEEGEVVEGEGHYHNDDDDMSSITEHSSQARLHPETTITPVAADTTTSVDEGAEERQVEEEEDGQPRDEDDDVSSITEHSSLTMSSM